MGQTCTVTVRQGRELPGAGIWPSSNPTVSKWTTTRFWRIFFHPSHLRSLCWWLFPQFCSLKCNWTSRSCLDWAKAKPTICYHAIPKPGLALRPTQDVVFDQHKARCPRGLAPARKAIKPPSLAQPARNSGSFTKLEESAKLLVFLLHPPWTICAVAGPSPPPSSMSWNVPQAQNLYSRSYINK